MESTTESVTVTSSTVPDELADYEKQLIETVRRMIVAGDSRMGRVQVLSHVVGNARHITIDGDQHGLHQFSVYLLDPQTQE